MPNYTKNCSFLHAHCTETLKVVEKFVKTLFYGEKHSFIVDMRQFQCVPQHLLLKLRKPILKYTLNKYHIHNKWLSSFKHHKLHISIKIHVTIMANCLYLHDSLITKFDFTNYAFVKLVVA